MRIHTKAKKIQGSLMSEAAYLLNKGIDITEKTREIFPEGLPLSYAFVATLRLTGAVSKERVDLWRVLSNDQHIQVAVTLHGQDRSATFITTNTADGEQRVTMKAQGIQVCKTFFSLVIDECSDNKDFSWHALLLSPVIPLPLRTTQPGLCSGNFKFFLISQGLFDGTWHQLKLLVRPRQVSCFVDDQIIQENDLEPVVPIYINGKTQIAKRYSAEATVPIEVQKLRLYCDPMQSERETACEILSVVSLNVTNDRVIDLNDDERCPPHRESPMDMEEACDCGWVSTGPPEPPGPKGVNGQDGHPDPVGKPGIRGEQGMPGDPGKTGENGKPGLPGLKGDPGIKGSKDQYILWGTEDNKGCQGNQAYQNPSDLKVRRVNKDSLECLAQRVEFCSCVALSYFISLKSWISYPQGDPGIPGIMGRVGSVGPKGDKGDTGLPGTDGPQGVPGIYGLPGEVGPEGPQGAKGPPGQKGTPEPRGPPGIQGPPGHTGADGQIGPKGSPGETGEAGLPGAPEQNGQIGEPGPKGTQKPAFILFQGERGSEGAPGVPGLPVSIPFIPSSLARVKLDPGDAKERKVFLENQGLEVLKGTKVIQNQQDQLGLTALLGKMAYKDNLVFQAILGNLVHILDAHLDKWKTWELTQRRKGKSPSDEYLKKLCLDILRYQLPQLLQTMTPQSCEPCETVKGPPGQPGAPGPKGSTGSLGYPGRPGSQGYPGSMGLWGPSGVKGDMGPRGFKGHKGEGRLGQPGPTGQPGIQGPHGIDGIGLQGPPGMPGKSGSPGTPGKRGDPGPAGVCDISICYQVYNLRNEH
ncbi:hypothetical protein P4O66_010111 [Electrophorus voltai]|uniref:Laminin G domain-containing protein n=1 Tax=Electrophorus voltai TaxID=2609070 RepID=A0AAD8ZBE8_9TELE|nr:hypothetical protein P4O66_010111 [Electrophorus voltai]